MILSSYDFNSDMVPFQLKNNALTLKGKVRQSAVHLSVLKPKKNSPF